MVSVVVLELAGVCCVTGVGWCLLWHWSGLVSVLALEWAGVCCGTGVGPYLFWHWNELVSCPSFRFPEPEQPTADGSQLRAHGPAGGTALAAGEHRKLRGRPRTGQ